MTDNLNFEKIIENIDGRECVIFKPANSNGKWVIKTEYLDAFPAVQNELLGMGYHIIHSPNKTRWCLDEDTDAQAKLIMTMHQKYGLNKKGGTIGMSCGGMQSIFLAAKYPELVSCMYLDAPVINFLSCPAGVGRDISDDMMNEFTNARGIGISELLSFRRHPLDFFDKIIDAKIPVMLVCGDSDTVVPYEENGRLLYDAYKGAGIEITQIIKQGCDHHPHSLEDNTPIIEFFEKFA